MKTLKEKLNAWCEETDFYREVGVLTIAVILLLSYQEMLYLVGYVTKLVMGLM